MNYRSIMKVILKLVVAEAKAVLKGKVATHKICRDTSSCPNVSCISDDLATSHRRIVRSDVT